MLLHFRNVMGPFFRLETGYCFLVVFLSPSKQHWEYLKVYDDSFLPHLSYSSVGYPAIGICVTSVADKASLNTPDIINHAFTKATAAPLLQINNVLEPKAFSFKLFTQKCEQILLVINIKHHTFYNIR